MGFLLAILPMALMILMAVTITKTVLYRKMPKEIENNCWKERKELKGLYICDGIILFVLLLLIIPIGNIEEQRISGEVAWLCLIAHMILPFISVAAFIIGIIGSVIGSVMYCKKDKKIPEKCAKIKRINLWFYVMTGTMAVIAIVQFIVLKVLLSTFH
ncbi:MAG: hypothetical protein E7284_08355 [Lachnospiraceae bacterium]|nr:hypothetical protein [Lachnospiraceae bacterium]